MGLFHVATITPSKAELIADWLPTRAWGPGSEAEVEVVGAFRFDDPEHRVGMETHLVTAGGTLYQVPLTYRDEPLAGAEEAFITEMEHSALGTRWVYDGLGDERYRLMLLAVTLTGQGETLGLAAHEGRWYTRPASARIFGGGWTGDAVAVDGLDVMADEGRTVDLASDAFQLRFHRTPTPGTKPAIALMATCEGHRDPVVLAQASATA
ncbi:MAG: hypothetical protein AAF962_04745 [Actinomycetota bacterium]